MRRFLRSKWKWSSRCRLAGSCMWEWEYRLGGEHSEERQRRR